MSWLPSNDPVLGDPKSCDALELVIVPRTRDLGDGFEVRRALPHGKRQMVGPFIFFDHFGPVQFMSGKGMDVRPHPHIGLATVTYLFDGSIMHRDSEGNIQEIQPGAMNLMTAGRGIAHSERTPDVQRRDGQKMLGLQSWIALPAASEEIAPSFQHYAAADLPIVDERGFTARVIAGSSFGVTSPVTMVSPWFYTEVTAKQGVSVPLDPDHEERAIYLIDGEIEIAGDRYQGPRLLIFRPGDRITVKTIKSDANDVSRRRCAGRPASYLVEFRFLQQGADRAGQAGLEDRPLRRTSPTNMSSFRCRSEPSRLPFRRSRLRDATAFESLADDHHARQRPALAADRARQGPRYLRRRRRPRAAADHRPHQRLRRGDGRDHPDEGRGADPDQRVVVQRARGRGAASHDQRRRRRDHRRSAGAERPSRRARRARDAVPAHHGVSDRMRDPRLSFRLGVEGICRAGHAGGRETRRPAWSKAQNSSPRSSARRPRPKPATTRTSRSRGCARFSATR